MTITIGKWKKCPTYQMTIDDADAPLLAGYDYFHVKRGYAMATKHHSRTCVPVHWLIIGQPLPGFVTDHIDGDTLNNSRSNLRVVTQHINQANRHRLNRNNVTSGIRGVYWAPQSSPSRPWKAAIGVHRRNIHLGQFATPEEAQRARIAGEVKYYGEPCPTQRKVA